MTYQELIRGEGCRLKVETREREALSVAHSLATQQEAHVSEKVPIILGVT